MTLFVTSLRGPEPHQATRMLPVISPVPSAPSFGLAPIDVPPAQPDATRASAAAPTATRARVNIVVPFLLLQPAGGDALDEEPLGGEEEPHDRGEREGRHREEWPERGLAGGVEEPVEALRHRPRLRAVEI